MEMVLERSACIPTCEDAQANTACNRVRRLIKCTISKLSVFYWRLSTFHVYLVYQARSSLTLQPEGGRGGGGGGW